MFGETQGQGFLARARRQHVLYAFLGRQSQYPWDHVRHGIEPCTLNATAASSISFPANELLLSVGLGDHRILTNAVDVACHAIADNVRYCGEQLASFFIDYGSGN